MADVPDISYLLGLPPEKAIEYLKEKGWELTWDWQELWQEAHAKTFTVAKVMKADILQDIRDAIQKALDNGDTFQMFQKDLTPILQAKGWWGKGTSGDQEYQMGSPRRLKVIYDTNMQTAYQAGRWKEFADNADNRPYLQYVAVMDSRTRPAHAALNGKIFPIDDPFWDSFYPPNGWNCRCRVRALSPGNIDQRQLRVGSSDGTLSEGTNYLTSSPDSAVPVTVYTDPATGMKISPDPGWSYNPGKAAWPGK